MTVGKMKRDGVTPRLVSDGPPGRRRRLVPIEDETQLSASDPQQSQRSDVPFLDALESLGGRLEEVIENASSFIIDRDRPRQHLSFGFGIHRCVGNRLAEMQLRVVWEEILKRWPDTPIEVVGEPERISSNLIKGYASLPVRIPG